MSAVFRLTALVAGLALVVAASAAAKSTSPPPEPIPEAVQRDFAAELKRDAGLDPKHVLATLATARKQQSILDAMARPAESKPWKDYRPLFLTEGRIRDGVAFYKAHRELIERAAHEYHMAPEIIVAILGVETGYGKNTGKYRVLDALATLAFHYPPRADFFRGELKQLFVLGDGEFPQPLTELRGSYAGAMGWGQFMPSSIAKYAVDYDGDGKVDLWNSLPDITASVARYFAAFGWEEGGPVAMRAQPSEGAREIGPGPPDPVFPLGQLTSWGYAPLVHVDPDRPSNLVRIEGDRGPEFWITFQNFYVITRYNRSVLYAMAVMQLAEAIAAGVQEPPA